MPRTVECAWLGREDDALDFIPWPGELGRRVYAGVGKQAWTAWLDHQTMLINENRLSPMNPQHRTYLAEQMEKFLFGGGADAAPGYTPDA